MLEKVLQEYQVTCSVQTATERVAGGFSGAAIWRVRTPIGDYALRRWPANSLPGTRLRGLHQLLRFVAAQGVSTVAVPLPLADGQTLLRMEGLDWQLEPWLPGQADFHDDPTDARLIAAVRGLAEWHRAAARFRPEREHAVWFASESAAPCPAVCERLQRIDAWLQGGFRKALSASEQDSDARFGELAGEILSMCGRVLPTLRTELLEYRNVDLRLQPCLRDVRDDHILFDGSRVTGIIDPSACRTENVTTDLARLTGSLAGDDRSRWCTAIDAYAEQNPLTDRERRLVHVLDRSVVVLSPLTWLQRRYLARVAIDVESVLPRLESQLQRLRAWRSP